ncbi:SMP-30/gluconolactonase/LRE family protein [Occallatibacter savannae]|uniref:SMP-30/gluconolactonase/LRE family protein n=1 Tax=Occallatibacter savannae TaxID=1002691 RepID=UPI000D68FC61|nr:PD40 domain-containing protein [Occallatibacter savannae]
MDCKTVGRGVEASHTLPCIRPFSLLILSLLILASCTSYAQPRLYTQETKQFRIVYYSPAHEYLAPLLIRSLENASNFYRQKFGYEPKGKITVLIQDFDDSGYGGAGTVPVSFIQIGIEPFNLVFETLPSAERMGLMSKHEMMHIVMGDEPAQRDALFRKSFAGKIMPNTDDPISIPFSFLGSPRVYSPRWFHEGAAVFMETWLGGGFGRGLGGYDEMVFRSLARDHRYIYDVVGLESEGTSADFQVGANSYLYGTRFMNYLARQYGPDKLTAWIVRNNASHAYFESQFRKVYGVSLHDEWRKWIATEREWQDSNLKSIQQYPLTPVKPLSSRVLGSISRSFYDPKSNAIYVAVRHTGPMPYIAAIHLDSGRVEHLTDVRGGAVYEVTSLAFDPDRRRLFFTTNNTHGLRALYVFDLATRKRKLIQANLRMGDLVFSRADGTIWGVRHDNGLSSIVRLQPNSKTLQVLHTLPYASDLFNLDISPDGKQLTGALVDTTGTQRLVRFQAADLLAEKFDPEVLHDFQYNSPDGFVFSSDGRYLYGSSYLTGASNLFRFDLQEHKFEALSNSETGLFRPLPLPDGSLAAFEYSARGFRLVNLPVKAIEDVNAIPYLGESVVEKFPELKSWNLPSRNNIDDLRLRTYAGFYHPLRNIQLQSAYPIVQGYQDSKAGGVRLDFGDSLGLSHMTATASYSPDNSRAIRDRLHAAIETRYWDWQLSGYFNRADFYDLFGPTKVGRRGFALVGEKRKNIIHDSDRTLDLVLNLSGYSGLDKLPDYQNVSASHTRFVAGTASLAYSNLQKSLGAVEEENGVQWSATAQINNTFPKIFPNVWGEYTRGFLLPLRNSSLWIRSSAGGAFGNAADPFANFYFGAFGNNWVDKRDFSRYRQYYSFPGVHIDQIGANNFAKSLVEWDLTPLHFRNLGSTKLYSNWARLALFTGGLVANPAGDDRAGYEDVGAQIDLRTVIFSQVKSTFSTGFALAHDRPGHTGTEFMFSLKIY